MAGAVTSLLIAGSNKFSLLASNPGCRMSRETNSRGTFDFTLQAGSSGYVPGRFAAVVIANSGGTIFQGFVDKITQREVFGTHYIEIDVHCVDYGVMLDRRSVYWSYQGAAASTLGIIVADINTRFLTGLGITLISTTDLSTPIGDIDFTAITCTEAFNKLADIANCVWYINAALELRFYSVTSGYTTAPRDFYTGSNNFRTFYPTRTNVRIGNRVTAKSSVELDAVWTDSTAGLPGPTSLYVTTYTQYSAPIVKVNGVNKIVVEINNVAQTHDFYYINNGIGVVSSNNYTGMTVTIEYPSPLPFVATAEDAASIASIGLREIIVEAGNITDPATLQLIADGALERAVEEPLQAAVSYDGEPFSPGMRFHAQFAEYALDDYFVTESVQSEQIGGNGETSFWRNSLKSSNAVFQRTSTPAKYYGDIIARARMTPVTAEGVRAVAGATVGLYDAPISTNVVTVDPANPQSQRISLNSATRATITAIGVPRNGDRLFLAIRQDSSSRPSPLFDTTYFATTPQIGSAALAYNYREFVAMDGKYFCILFQNNQPSS